MGNSYPHFNLTSLSYIICTTPSDLINIIKIYKNKYPNEEDLKVTKDSFSEILIQANIHESGKLIFFIYLIHCFILFYLF